jgi:hypothetical protein
VRDTDRLFPDVVEGVGACVDDLALDLVCPTTVVPQAASSGRDIDALGHAEGLAVIESLNSGEQVGVLLEKVGELHEKLSTVLRSLLPPWAFEGLARRGDGNVDILLGSLLDFTDDFFGRGVDDLEGLAVNGLDEFVVDEPGRVSIEEGQIPIIFGQKVCMLTGR